MSYKASDSTFPENTFNELKQRLEKLKSRERPRNPLKKLPGYGTAWYYRKRKSLVSSNEIEEEHKIDVSVVNAFVKKLRTRPPPEETEEDMTDVVQGPGFEFPNEKEANKTVKQWSKRFKQWQPMELAVPALRSILRFKPIMPKNEIEVRGKRYRRLERREDAESLLRFGVPALEKRPLTLNDARFYGETLKDENRDIMCRFVMSKNTKVPEGVELRDLIREGSISEVYATQPYASKFVTEMKKHLTSLGNVQAAQSLQLRSLIRTDNRKQDLESTNKDSDLKS